FWGALIRHGRARHPSRAAADLGDKRGHDGQVVKPGHAKLVRLSAFGRTIIAELSKTRFGWERGNGIFRTLPRRRGSGRWSRPRPKTARGPGRQSRWFRRVG